jgi:hypothetical protein
MAGGFNGTQQIIDIPASTGAFLAILATGPVRKIEVEESPITAEGTANTLIGLIEYKIPNDDTTAGFTTVFEAIGSNDITSQGQIIPAAFELSDGAGLHGHEGSILGNGSSFLIGVGATPATTLCLVRSGGAATSVRVRQTY